MRSNSRRNKRRKQPIINEKIKKIIPPIIIIFALLFFSCIFALTNSLNEKIIKGIKINDIDVSYLTIDEAYEKLKQQFKEDIKVKQEDNYETTISLEQLEVDYDLVDAISQAYKVGRNKNILVSNFQILKNKIFQTNIEKEIKLNEEELNKIVDDISIKIPGVVEESSYYIENDSLIISSGKSGIQVKKEEFKNKIIEQVKNQLNGKRIEYLEIPVEEKQPDKINIEKIREEIYKEAQDAYYEENPFKLYKEINGVDLKISIEEAKRILEEQKKEYIIPLNITKPKVTTSNLKYENFFPEQISKYLTRYDESNINRSTNIKLASEKIDGTILMPGETFSYNKTVGKRTEKAGYKEAGVYMNGKVVDGIGGGICQVSSTLYNAVLEANLEIVERKNHHFITSYVPVSKDATVSYGTIDFKFKNTRSYPIKITCKSQNGICEITINGIKEETEYEVVIEEKVTEIIPYETRYIKTNKLQEGKENEIQKGVDGYKSEAYRILKLNGQVISKTLLSKDSYNPLERVVEIGTK